MEQSPDDRMWTALVASAQEHARVRAEFHQRAAAPANVLGRALANHGWDRSTALEFLADFSDDVPVLLDQLLDISLSHGWALAARQAIDSAWRAGLVPELPEKVLAMLDRADGDEYRRLAELLEHVQAWKALNELVRRAAASADPEIAEVAGDFREPGAD